MQKNIITFLYLFHLGAIQHIEEVNGFQRYSIFIYDNRILEIKNPDPNENHS